MIQVDRLRQLGFSEDLIKDAVSYQADVEKPMNFNYDNYKNAQLVAAIVQACTQLNETMQAAQEAKKYEIHKRLYQIQTELMIISTDMLKDMTVPENKQSQSDYDKETFYK